MSVPKTIDLPTSSPFFGKVTASGAADHLRDVYINKLKSKPTGPSAKLATAITAAIKKKQSDRAPMGIGVAILAGESPYFVGANSERLYSVHSIGKLALLYAAYQLRADLAVIGNTKDLAANKPYDYKARVNDLINATRTAFMSSSDSTLKLIGQSQDFPKLARIFNLWEYLKADPPNRTSDMLELSVLTSGTSVDDDQGFGAKLIQAVSGSDNPHDAYCILDIGLPYIQALMQRSGFASLHAPNRPGLWLSHYYQPDDVVSKLSAGRRGRAVRDLPYWLRDLPVSQRDAINAPYQSGQLMTDINPQRNNAPGFKSGHVGTAVGLATFLTQLDSGELVDEESSAAMLDYLGKSRFITREFHGLGDGTIHSKVGYTPPRYGDCAIIESRSIGLAATKKPTGSSGGGTDAGSSPDPSKTVRWIAVGLDALGPSDKAHVDAFDDGGILEDLGADLETAVADST